MEEVSMVEYVVFVDDNYHYQDENERFKHGEFKTAAEAIEACKNIVERSLVEAFQRGMTAEQLLSQYRMFGEDPFVVPGVGFSAWTYAEERGPSFLAERSTTARSGS
jgi:hypothetical protein